MNTRTGSATESRTPVSALRGQRPGPLDDGAVDASFLRDSNPGTNPSLEDGASNSSAISFAHAAGLKQSFESLDAPGEWFWCKVDRSGGPDACWPWLGAKTREGYGIVTRDRTSTTAIRVVFKACVGPIPARHVIDHIKCDNPSCVNYGHLRAVTQQVNILRGVSPSALCARKTHCKNGHPFDLLNTRINSHGRRICQTCYPTRGLSGLPAASHADARAGLSASPSPRVLTTLGLSDVAPADAAAHKEAASHRPARRFEEPVQEAPMTTINRLAPQAVEHPPEWQAEMRTLKALGLSHVQAWDVLQLRELQAEAVATVVLFLAVQL